MRSRGPSKQRLWLGSCRYSCCGGRRYTDTDAHRYSDGDRHANGQPHCNSNGNGDAATDANTEVGAIAKAASHAFAQALDFSLSRLRLVEKGLEHEPALFGLRLQVRGRGQICLVSQHNEKFRLLTIGSVVHDPRRDLVRRIESIPSRLDLNYRCPGLR